jgi:hypothetical protein
MKLDEESFVLELFNSKRIICILIDFSIFDMQRKDKSKYADLKYMKIKKKFESMKKQEKRKEKIENRKIKQKQKKIFETREEMEQKEEYIFVLSCWPYEKMLCQVRFVFKCYFFS